jgi:hypothetical protein
LAGKSGQRRQLHFEEAHVKPEELKQKIADGVAAVKAMTPEQRKAHFEKQRKSWVVSELMLAYSKMTKEEAEALYDEVVGR